MNSLRINFILKAFVIPIAITAIIASSLTLVYFPRVIEKSNATATLKVSDVDISKYSITEYNSFKDLRELNYVASVENDELGIKCPVLYLNSDSNDAAHMLDGSVEPWANGSMAIVGENLNSQFKRLHGATIGDEFTVDFYSNEQYTYRITKIEYNKTEEDVKSYMGNRNLVLGLQYNDFSGAEDSYLYIVYVAQLVG